MDNPFPVIGYKSARFFCDRVFETAFISRAIQSQRNITLAGPRRIGKTALIYHVSNKLKRSHSFIYFDLLPTNNLSEFINGFINNVSEQFSERTSLGKKLWSWIKQVRPLFTIDPLSGTPQVSIDLATKEIQKRTLHEVISILEAHDKRILIALDEFQQITQYNESWFEAWLRSEIQDLKNLNFIFSGSHHGILSSMFQIPSRPFYSSTEFMFLDKIPREEYAEFIQKHLKRISSENVESILDWTDDHTYYVQYVCNRLFSLGSKTITSKMIFREFDSILKQMQPIFLQYRELLTKGQWNLMYAIGKEDRVFEPTSAGFIQKYQLGNAASVRRALLSLEEKELIYKEVTNEGHYYHVYDIFLKRWLQSILKIF